MDFKAEIIHLKLKFGVFESVNGMEICGGVFQRYEEDAGDWGRGS